MSSDDTTAAAPPDQPSPEGDRPVDDVAQGDRGPHSADPPPAPAPPPPTLLPDHQKLIEDSGISSEVARARGYRSVTKKKEVEELGFSKAQCRVPALVHPVHDVRGEVVLHQIRPDEPRCSADGKVIKYETPSKAKMRIDVPPAARAALGNPLIRLLITEGVRKADSAVSRGSCCIALLGVWNWRGKNGMGGLTALADWESIALKGREVFIVFDSDVMRKAEVHGALARLQTFLESRGAKVNVVYLPDGDNGAKVGLDDFFVAGGTVDQLVTLASDKLQKSPTKPSHYCPYEIIGDGIFHNKQTNAGVVSVPLTNFVPLIVANVIEDDGVETRHAYEIEARVGGQVIRIRVSGADFSAMNWPYEHLGSQAVIYAGSGTKDHTRAAIMLLSEKPPVRRVYLHTGWRLHGDEWVYLHAGGAIGASGAVPGVEVKLDGNLSRYRLPGPPSKQDLIAAVQSSLRILELGDLNVTAPTFASIWRSVLGPCDVTLHFVGETGVFKTEVVALAVRHFGSEMDADRLPGSWLSTGNSLEAMAFQIKDALFPIDDFVPAQSADAPRLHREAERLLRAKGNSAGRARMRSDTTLRPAKPPRALLLSSGEDTPRGQSLRARMFIIPVRKSAIDAKKLSGCQLDASSGAYARAMVGFIQWLAPQMAGMEHRLVTAINSLRDELDREGMHRRTPETVASLALGLKFFFDFAVEIGAVTTEERRDKEKKAMAALVAVAEDQQEHHESNEATRRFLELLNGAITSGAAHVADPHGGEPSAPESWGWFRRGDGAYFTAQGARVGWVDGDNLYLDADAAYCVVQRLGRDSGEGLAITLPTLKRRLKEKGLLVATDVRAGKERFEVRHVLSGSRRSVLHLRASSLLPPDPETDKHQEEPDPPAAPPPGSATPDEEDL